MKSNLSSRVVTLIFFVALGLYLPIRGGVEIEAAVERISSDWVVWEFSLVRLVTPICLLFLVRLVLGRWRSREVEVGYRIFVGLVAVLFLAMFLYILLLESELYDRNGISVQKYNMGVLLSYILCLSLGAFAWKVIELPRAMLVLWLGMVLQVASVLDFEKFSVSVSQFDVDKFDVYLLYGDSFAVWSLLTLSAFRQQALRLFIFGLSLLVCFVLYSRTSFYALVFVGPAFYLLMSRSVRVILVIAAGVLASLAVFSSDVSLVDHRMFDFIIAGDDASWYLRQIQAIRGFQELEKSWFFGDYAGQVLDFGVVGAYIHSIVSYWRQFGIIVFCAILYLIGVCVSASWRGLVADRYVRVEMAPFILLSAFLLFEVAFSRSYVFPYLWLLFGMYLGMPGHLRRMTRRGAAGCGSCRKDTVA